MKEVVIRSAKNKKGATNIEDFQIDADNDDFPGGEGKFIKIDGEYKLEHPISMWCFLKITDSQIIIRDGIVNNPHRGVNRRLINRYVEYLRQKCGGEEIDINVKIINVETKS